MGPRGRAVRPVGALDGRLPGDRDRSPLEAAAEVARGHDLSGSVLASPDFLIGSEDMDCGMPPQPARTVRGVVSGDRCQRRGRVRAGRSPPSRPVARLDAPRQPVRHDRGAIVARSSHERCSSPSPRRALSPRSGFYAAASIAGELRFDLGQLSSMIATIRSISSRSRPTVGRRAAGPRPASAGPCRAQPHPAS